MSPISAPVPHLDIPQSTDIVTVSVIDTTARLANVPTDKFFDPITNGFEKFQAPAYAFLIEHGPLGKKLLFDLGVRKDVENHARVILGVFEKWDMKIEKNVSEILLDNGVELESINDIVWSHRHFDHTGDPSQFPASTNLVVGPGFKDAIGPGYPYKDDSPCTASAWEGRQLVELDFTTDKRATHVGRYRAIDWFGDGSFYLLQSPGHTADHMCGFARTKLADQSPTGRDEFILMGGDVAHHGGEYKPNKYTPIPNDITPDPRLAPFSGGVCPGELFARHNQRFEGEEKWTNPFVVPAKTLSENFDEAIWSLGVLEELDSQDNVLVIFAHDTSLLDIMEF
jgi:glyoxylase-like metal-dependent hydrolase (beta-lactamase superfamily II)